MSQFNKTMKFYFACGVFSLIVFGWAAIFTDIHVPSLKFNFGFLVAGLYFGVTPFVLKRRMEKGLELVYVGLFFAIMYIYRHMI